MSEHTVDEFNAAHPSGTPVRYWSGARTGAGVASVTRSMAWLLGGHTPVVMVDGYAGGIALSHVEPIPTHTIRWEFDGGHVSARAVCNAAPGADCRLTSVSCECERWGKIQRRDDGTIWHHIVDYGDSHEPVWHEVKPMDECNVVLFLSEDIEELAVRGTRFTLAEVPIEPVWETDGCEWKPAATTNREVVDA